MSALARLTVAEADVLADCEETISHGLQTFVEVGTALALIRDNRLYRVDYDTFEAYCQQRWNLSRPRAYELMTAASAVSGMPDTDRPVNARQAVELARVPEPERTDVWRAANEATNGKPTAAAIREAANPDRPSATGEAHAGLDAAATASEAPTGMAVPVGAGETADGSLGAPSDASDTEPAWTPGADAAGSASRPETDADPVTPNPVRVSLNVEFPGGSESMDYEIDRAEWEAMTPAERTKDIEEAASDHAYNYVGWGWHIADPADYADTQGVQP